MKSLTFVPALPGPRARLLAGIAVLTAATGLLAAMHLPPRMAGVVTLLVFCIAMWATAAVPEYWPALAFFAVAAPCGLAPPQEIFSGLSSTTFWMLFSGAVIGAAIGHTGLGKRAAGVLSAMLGRTYAGVIAGIVLFSVALAFVMPSGMGRVVLLIPITMAVADHLGYGPGHAGRTGMLMAAAFSSFLPTFAILPSNAPNMILSGMAENLYGLRISYADYLLLHFPVLGALKSVLLAWLILRGFPAPDPVRGALPLPGAAPMSGREKALACVLALCLALWMTDGLHHVSPAWIGLAAALVCLWPDAGLTSKKCLSQDVNYGSLLFVAGVMGLGAAISSSGLGEAVVRELGSRMPFAAGVPAWNAAVLALIATGVALVTNLAGVPATMTPLAQELAHATGLPLPTVLMVQVLAFSNVCLPFQAPPLIFAMQMAGLKTADVTNLCLTLFAFGLLVLLPLDLLWWRVLGML